MEFTNKQRSRYARNLLLTEVGARGQEKLTQGKVLIIGAGGLGSPAALYLAAAGVGTIGIVDGDAVDLSNLQRQILYTTGDVGRSKVDSAWEKMTELNPDITVRTYHTMVNSRNIMEILANYDFIIDATDNFQAKFLINDACVIAQKPFSHGGILRFQGQLMTYVPERGPCYRCIFQTPPPAAAALTCRQVGVMGAICGVIGSLQAMEAIKFLLREGELLVGYLLTYDALKMEFRKVKLPSHRADCAVCGMNPTIITPRDEACTGCNGV